MIGLVEWSTSDFGTGDGLLLLVRQAGIGAVGGLLVGSAGVWLLRRLPLPSAGLAPVITVAIALAGAVGVSLLDGSGLLAAYLIGLVIGDARIPHAAVVRGFLQGAAWLAQLGLFVLLGLLVTPSRVLDEGLGPILVAIALVLVARPLAVLVCTTPFGLSLREQGFLAWAGLRGGVPIVLATFPVAAGVPGAARVFDAVFFVVVLSVAAQGLTMRWAARTLGLIEPHPAPRLAEMDSATLSTLHSELVELRAEDLGIRAGTLVRDAELPGAAIIVAIRRDHADRAAARIERAGGRRPPLPAGRERQAARRAGGARPRRDCRRRAALGRQRAVLGLAGQAEQVLQPPAGAATSSPSALKLEPQPQDATALGLLTVNPAPMRPSTKSTSAPLRYGRLKRSTTTLTPCWSATSSPGWGSPSKPSAYWRPEHPPPCTATRSASASGSSRMRASTCSRSAFGERDHALMVPPAQTPESPTL